MSTDSSVKWIDVDACPIVQSKYNEVTVPTGTNKDNFIVLEYGETVNFFHKYNIETNKWTKMNLSDKLKSKFTVCYPTLDVKQKMLYFLDENCLMQMELNSKKIIKHSLSSENNHNSNSQCVILNNELFVIGGDECYSISKWNAKTKKLTQINTIYNKTMLDVFGWTYDYKANCMLLFGGYDNNNTNGYVDYILEYDVTKNELNKLQISLPIPMCNLCCLNAINNKYVLIFKDGFDDIYIYSIKTQTITKSKIKCPSKHTFSGIIVNDKMKDEKTVFGFVRNTWKICEIDNHYFPPFDLLKLIHLYYLNEWVYLLDEETGKHYKMSTLDII